MNVITRWALRTGAVGVVALGAGWVGGAASASGIGPADVDAAYSALLRAGSWIDTNGDNVGDLLVADYWGDGSPNAVAADFDQNRYLDLFITDLDNDGSAESAAADTDFDGYWDVVIVDGYGDAARSGSGDGPMTPEVAYSMNMTTLVSSMMPVVYGNL
jgi:hypothetical protein